MFATRHTAAKEIDAQDPPTPEDSESEASVLEPSKAFFRKPARTSTHRQNLGHKRSLCRNIRKHQAVSVSEQACGQSSTTSSQLALNELSDASNCGNSVSERSVDVGRVGSWAASFNTLLEDPVGLHMFSEFLKKEFSQENITFWVACERYRQIKDPSLLAKAAKEIYSKHLCIGAQEPVNVDSHARQVAQDGLKSATAELFLPAQKQIFNLMKFDCYQRFLKSSMFKDCLMREGEGQPLLFQDQSQDVGVVEKTNSLRELKKQRSLIPWHKASKGKFNETVSGGSKIQSWKTSKKKHKEHLNSDDACSSRSELSDSSSLAGNEPGVGMIHKEMSSQESLNSESILFSNHCDADYNYCRVILPDLSTTVVRIQKGETLGEMLLNLLEKRNLAYNAVEAYVVGSSQPLNHSTDVTTLSCKEIKVEQVILFCVELPNKKTIGVKSKSNKKCLDILKPVLVKYGYKLNQVKIICKASQQVVNMHSPITSIDNQRIVIREVIAPASDGKSKLVSNGNHSSVAHSFLDLEELTNQIFDDLLKNGPHLDFDGLRVIDYSRTANNINPLDQDKES